MVLPLIYRNLLTETTMQVIVDCSMELAFSPYLVHRVVMQEDHNRCKIVILISPMTQSIHDLRMIRAPILTLGLEVREAHLSCSTIKMTQHSSMNFYRE
jgi:hypothetical protein